MLLLTENHNYTVSELCERMGISRRNLYYYLEFFRDCGFNVIKSGTFYKLDRNSPFFDHLFSRISLTEEEAVLVHRALDRTERGNPLTVSVKEKLARFYDLDILADEELREHSVQNLRALYDAIKTKRQAVLTGYASPHSRTVRDRFVEPFLLMHNNNEVRCYEPSTGLNKTFKLSRMQGVRVLDSAWTCEDKHREMFTDVFMFSGEELLPVDMLLGTLSYNVLKEEYPHASRYVTPTGDNRYRLRMDVCSYAGIGRFVLGLYDDIEVSGGPGFLDYLRRKIEGMAERVKKFRS